MFRGAALTPEKLVDFGMMLAGACDIADAADKEGGGLLGLSPGIRLVTVLDGRCAISDADVLWVNLLDGPCGRPMIFRDAIWVSEARFTGLCGADAPLDWRGAAVGAVDFADASAFALRSSAGAAELRKRPVKPKMLRFLDGGSMMSIVRS